MVIVEVKNFKGNVEKIEKLGDKELIDAGLKRRKRDETQEAQNEGY
jgi:hypothetical protein